MTPIIASERLDAFPGERLPFQLPDFVRVSWVSDRAREKWAPRLVALIRMWQDVERRSVLEGVRRCAIVRNPRKGTAPEEGSMSSGLRVLVERDLPSKPAPKTPFGNGAHDASGLSAYLVVSNSLADAEAMQEAWDLEDHDRIGELLGYPSCCRVAFIARCSAGHLIDHTWAMGAETTGSVLPSLLVQQHGVRWTNVLWRPVGVRTVPHLPCRFDCHASQQFGVSLLAIARGEQYESERGWLHQILSWPVEWSSLHGIAEIKTPIMKIATTSDAVSIKISLSWEGEMYPEEGAQGVTFPYRTPERAIVSDSTTFLRGLAEAGLVQIRGIQERSSC